MVLPTPLWTSDQSVRLAAGETKTIAMATETVLPEGEMVSIALGDQKSQILMRTLSQGQPAVIVPETTSADRAVAP